MNDDSDDEDGLIKIRNGSMSPTAGGAKRGGRGRSPQQPSQKFATLQQPERRSYALINKANYFHADEVKFFDDEKRRELYDNFVNSRPINAH